MLTSKHRWEQRGNFQNWQLNRKKYIKYTVRLPPNQTHWNSCIVIHPPKKNTSLSYRADTVIKVWPVTNVFLESLVEATDMPILQHIFFIVINTVWKPNAVHLQMCTQKLCNGKDDVLKQFNQKKLTTVHKTVEKNKATLSQDVYTTLLQFYNTHFYQYYIVYIKFQRKLNSVHSW